uniref:Mitochondrial phosphate carrier protein n=1 Tax=Panagrolaimus sp. JU765 TaxID=591449 RepID=A0AC34R2Y5_9BILA
MASDLRSQKPDIQTRNIPPGLEPTVDVPQILNYHRKMQTKAGTQKECSGQVASSKTANEIKIGTLNYVVVCGFAGTLVAGGSHLLSTPLDVIKCRIQANSGKYPNFGAALKKTVAEEGIRGLVRGWAPTFIGYGAQGFAKF